MCFGGHFMLHQFMDVFLLGNDLIPKMSFFGPQLSTCCSPFFGNSAFHIKTEETFQVVSTFFSNSIDPFFNETSFYPKMLNLKRSSQFLTDAIRA